MSLTLANLSPDFFDDCRSDLQELEVFLAEKAETFDFSSDEADLILCRWKHLIFASETMWANCADRQSEALEIRAELKEAHSRIDPSLLVINHE